MCILCMCMYVCVSTYTHNTLMNILQLQFEVREQPCIRVPSFHCMSQNLLLATVYTKLAGLRASRNICVSASHSAHWGSGGITDLPAADQ